MLTQEASPRQVGLQSLAEGLIKETPRATSDAQGNSEKEKELETLFPAVADRRKRPNESKATSAHNVFTHYPEDPNGANC